MTGISGPLAEDFPTPLPLGSGVRGPLHSLRGHRAVKKDLESARRRTDKAAKRLRTGGNEAGEEFSAALDDQAEAERALAAARGEEHAIPFELGVRWSVGAPLPHLLTSGKGTFVAFYLAEHDPDWDGTYVRIVDPTDEEPASLALAEFKGCAAVKLGPPNDEVLHGHPLYERGLNGYGAYVVANSRWLAELVEINRVHDQFNPRAWEGLRHFFFVFHDEIVEAIARDVEVETFRESVPSLLGQTIARLWPGSEPD
jgi:hypothetical protein